MPDEEIIGTVIPHSEFGDAVADVVLDPGKVSTVALTVVDSSQ